GRHQGDAPADLVEAMAAGQQLADHQWSPTLGEHLGGLRHRTELAVPVHRPLLQSPDHSTTGGCHHKYRNRSGEVQIDDWPRPPSQRKVGSYERSDQMTAIRAAHEVSLDQVDALRGQLRGTVVLPADASYDEDRRVWNGMVD